MTKPPISNLAGYRLSPQQEAALAAPGVTRCAVLLHGDVDAGALRAGLDELVARHEILRTTFARPAGVSAPQQVVHDVAAVRWADGDEAFDLAEGPVLAARLEPLDARRHLLTLTAPAATADGFSLLTLVRELADAPADEPLQYADYAEWRHALLTDEEDDTAADRAEAQAFWRSGEDGWPAVRVLFGTAASGPARSLRTVALDEPRLRAAAAEQGVTADLFLEACWHALIARLTGEDELVLARTEDGRWQPDLQDAVGPYAHRVPVVTTHASGPSPAELVDQISRGRSRAARLQDFAPAAELNAFAGAVRIGFSAAATALAPVAGAERAEVVALTPAPGAPALELAVRDDGHRLKAELQWDPAAYADEDAAAVADALETLLAGAVADPTARPAIVTAEQVEVLGELAAGPAVAADALPVHERFAAQARRAPGDVAVRAGAASLTYGELDAAAAAVAAQLRAIGVAGRAVGLCMDRSPAMIAALLGILRAGAAYVPLNLEHPAPRLAHQLAETGAAALVTQAALRDALPAFDGPVIEADRPADAAAPAAPAQVPAGLDDLAYVMYTSGSTGMPKGVEVTHRSLAVYTQGILDLLGRAGAPRHFAVVSAISTDLGNTCVFPALTSGGCLHLIDPDTAMDPDALAAEAREHPYDVLKITPSHLRALVAGDDAAVLPRECLLAGGEALPWALVERVRALAPGLRLLNHYGPTEATVGCCAFELDGHDAAGTGAATVPVGRALAGDRVHVLDRDLVPVPVGVPGELCVGGAGVARGYAARPDETAARFVTPPGGRERLYRTGDRARRLRDGAIEFLGRLDDQVKIRGHRVEPGEVEAVLLAQDGVREAAVVARPAEDGELRLVAYVVGTPAPDAGVLRAALAAVLPEPLVPSAFVALDALPFTPSGKVDRRALPEPEAAATGAPYVAPRDELEEEIAGIWAGLLKVERVGVHDDFFALGGHSLLATQVIMAIRRRHGDVPLRALLAAPTVADLAEAVRRSG